MQLELVRSYTYSHSSSSFELLKNEHKMCPKNIRQSDLDERQGGLGNLFVIIAIVIYPFTLDFEYSKSNP